MNVIYAKCHICDSRHAFQNQAINDVRMKSCERCHVRLTVTGGETITPRFDSPPQMPDRERRALTEKETDDARRLLADAFGRKE